MNLFLTPEEIHELTGLRIPAYQCRWLEKHGYIFETNASGKPKVLRAFLMQKLGMEQSVNRCRNASKIDPPNPVMCI